ncbi:hypothetical protein QZJ86_06235 [Methylomonas montana]|uniref:hypothetical protein n=1 Tax=Methylomonas montana TaxID=3058963 RepID=UPI0026582F48|nr:hypothetical protein [Methylomonas montana]WKJ91733.1 hypothetical protein QZJ86_06235 [Methylomonas montana]
MKRVCTLLALMLISGISAGVEPYTCRNGSFPSFERIQYAEISGSKNVRSYFYDDEKGCPERSSCMLKSYLVKGDKVLFSELGDDQWVCVWYFGKRHEYVGLMNRSNFNLLQEKTPSLQDWAGIWRPTAGNNEIRIKILPDGRLSVSGNASWHGGKNDYNEEIVHEGEMSGDGIPSSTMAELRCDIIDQDVSVIRQKYTGNWAVQEALAAASEL